MGPSAADKYFQIRQMCFRDHRPELALEDPAPSPYSDPNGAGRYLSTLQDQCATNGDTKIRVEEALRCVHVSGYSPVCDFDTSSRYLSGMNVPGVLYEEGALQLLEPILNPKVPEGEIISENEWMVLRAPPPVAYTPAKDECETLKAHALATYAYFRRFMARTKKSNGIAKDDTPTMNLLGILRHASHAAAFDFLPPVVLLAGFTVRTFLESPDMGFHLEDLRSYRPLWRALERFLKRWSTVPSQTPAYSSRTCAAAGCATEVPEQSLDRQLCWPCEFTNVDGKNPVYCSLECQHHDWLRHQVDHTDAPGATNAPVNPAVWDTTVRDDLEFHEEAVRELPLEQVEILTEDEDRRDARNGEVVWEALYPCPMGTGRTARSRVVESTGYSKLTLITNVVPSALQLTRESLQDLRVSGISGFKFSYHLALLGPPYLAGMPTSSTLTSKH
ncbi:hypothetical protein C8Q77DRAFT_1075145 [Trametes polyzona]|nr:hypothetical protein C8Q77DRAFT_1075145 [Trametes polyzona]